MIKTWVLDNEKAVMEAVAFIRSIEPANYPKGSIRIEFHENTQSLEYYSDETANLGSHQSGHE